ncbi:MAG: tRNA uridine-5-carboxymethylaminomethyl(34) synthesis GTPase MnmE [Rickettsiales bacterium]|nr:tRNA uridine-5-carboxymethylaminomethyl(34) synthesis GTPase MnmE [Rickettsiales bacterium]
MPATIFAPITFPTKAGVSLIRISGEKTRECLETLGVAKIPNANEIKFCKIFDPKNAELIDETLISFFKAPNSFTGDDVAEISIHASSFILKKIFQILSGIENVRMAEAGEFSKVAFLNGKIDLVQAEAIPDLIACETSSQHKQSLKQLQGDLGKIYENWRLQIIELLALIESCIDFPDEDLPQNIIDDISRKLLILKDQIASHLDDKKRGQKIKDGLSLTIIGSPNVGKSSLLNFLAKSEVAIVSEIAGTTRDVIEIHLEIAGVAIKIADTAGLRESKDKIEQEGIRRAYKKAAEADIKLLVLDAMNPKISAAEKKMIDENTIIIVNKIDLIKLKTANNLLELDNKNLINLSIKKQQNTDSLIQKLEEKVLELLPKQSSPLITQERYRHCLSKAISALDDFSLDKNIELAAEDLRIASYAIAKITGRIDVDDILDVVFSKFCIGK